MPRKRREQTETTQIFAEWLKIAVEKSNDMGISREMICDSAGITKSQLSDYINDKKTPSIDTFYNICKALKTAPNIVFRFMPEKHTENLLGIVQDINPNEIAAHIADGTLADWCMTIQREIAIAIYES